MKDPYFERVLDKAYEAATAAIREAFDKGLREGPMNCGFAWAKTKGNHSFGRYCLKMAKRTRDRRYGDKGVYGGLEFWGPGEWPTSEEMGFTVYAQDMDFKLIGAQAFAMTVRDLIGEPVGTGCRLD